MNVLKRHPLSALFAQYDLKGDDLANLAEDIRKNGQLLPITLLHGEVLDGWNRYQACQLAGAQPVTMDLAPGVDPWEFVKGSNMLRRHMAPAERVAVFLLKERMEGVPNGTPSVRGIQKDLEVGKGTAERAATVARANDPVLEQALADKRVSLDRAADLAKLPPEERQAALEAPPAPKAKTVPEPRESGNASLDLAIQLIKTAFSIPEGEAIVPFLQGVLKGKDDEISGLKDQLAEMAGSLRAATEDNESMDRIIRTDDRLTALMDEVKRFKEQARVSVARVRGITCELNDAKHYARLWKKKFDALEKKVKGKAEASELGEAS